MALIIPTSFSSFGDGTRAEGNRTYVLAQFRETADFGWVEELRHELGQSELKYKYFHANRARLRQQRPLWSRLLAGLGQATIIVVDVDSESIRAFLTLSEQRGRFGYDFGDQDVFKLMTRTMIARSPIAFLPNRLMEALPDADLTQIASLRDFTPEAIQKSIGTDLRSATVFAARAHAVFDVDTLRNDKDAATTRDAFVSPFASLVLTEVLSSPRCFDEEDSKSVAVLNRASDTIARALQEQLPCLQATVAALVAEQPSHARDQLQAADMAAGWAREMVDLDQHLTLTNQFAHVWINGCKMR